MTVISYIGLSEKVNELHASCLQVNFTHFMMVWVAVLAFFSILGHGKEDLIVYVHGL